MADEKIIDRIQKLLSLAGNNPNSNEAEAALLKAQKLMAQYKIDEQRVKDASTKVETLDITSMMSSEPVRSPWKRYLASIIADNFRCLSYLNNQGQGRIYFMFFGEREDVEVAYAIYEYTVVWLNKRACNYATNLRNTQGIVKGVKQDFIIGFLNGLRDKFNSEKVNDTELALALTVDTQVTTKYNDMAQNFVKMNLSNSINVHGLEDARNDGYEEGRRFSTNALREG